MFERYTDKARRVIFFGRYEASHYGSSAIGPEHLLLGLVREESKVCRKWVPATRPETIRERIDGWLPRCTPMSTAVDLPLTAAGKRVLHRAKEEADGLHSKWIGTEHLLLGLIEEDSPVSKLLVESGADASELRTLFEKEYHSRDPITDSASSGRLMAASTGPVEIHGRWRNANAVRERVKLCKLYNWHWHKAPWKPKDLVIEKSTGKISFDISLAEDTASFEIVRDGGKKDKCAICGWELFESSDDHGSGYSNGRQWICLECFDKFWQRPGFISGSYSDLT